MIAAGTRSTTSSRGRSTGCCDRWISGINTDVGRIGLTLTPTEALRFDLGYMQHPEGRVPPDRDELIGSPGGTVTELAIPIENIPMKLSSAREFARPEYALQFNYTGSFFRNNYDSYTWDNPLSSVRLEQYSGRIARGNHLSADLHPARLPRQLGADLGGTGQFRPHVQPDQDGGAAPANSDQWDLRLYDAAAGPDFIYNVPNPDDNLIRIRIRRAIPAPTLRRTSSLGNIQLTSRPIDRVTVTPATDTSNTRTTRPSTSLTRSPRASGPPRCIPRCKNAI